MLRLSDENMVTNPQCYKDRDDLSMSFMSMGTTKSLKTY